MACEYPGDQKQEQARRKLTALLDAGITDFYDLTEAHELLPYEPLLSEMGASRGVKVHYQWFPIRDVNIPNRSYSLFP